MCLGLPMRIRIKEDGKAIAELEGVEREVDLSLIEDPKDGDYVIIHSGFAINKIDPIEAQKTLDLIREITGNQE